MNDRVPRLSDELPVEAEAHPADLPRESAPGGAGRIGLCRRKEPHPFQQGPLRLCEQHPAVPAGASGCEMNPARTRLRAASRKALGRARRKGRAQAGDGTGGARGTPSRADLLAEVHERGCEVAGISVR